MKWGYYIISFNKWWNKDTKVKQFVQSHTAGVCWDFNPGSLTPDAAVILITTLYTTSHIRRVVLGPSLNLGKELKVHLDPTPQPVIEALGPDESQDIASRASFLIILCNWRFHINGKSNHKTGTTFPPPSTGSNVLLKHMECPLCAKPCAQDDDDDNTGPAVKKITVELGRTYWWAIIIQVVSPRKGDAQSTKGAQRRDTWPRLGLGIREGFLEEVTSMLLGEEHFPSASFQEQYGTPGLFLPLYLPNAQQLMGTCDS